MIARHRLTAVLALGHVFAACGQIAPSAGGPSPSTASAGSPAATTGAVETAAPTAEQPRAELVIGCMSIEAAECRFVAERIVEVLPAGRDAPFAIEITLYPCANPAIGAPCPKTLAARQGKAVVEFTDGEEPIDLSLAGQPQSPVLTEQEGFYLGLTNPSSPRVGGVGPFPFELGHCGLSHVIDFDGSFWVPVGQVDGDHPSIINAERGQIRLLGPDRAEFRGESGFVAHLARFPGPKFFWGCD